ncbi:MAG: 50S ribosomal protein L5 [Candidatus Diapherotrites archaeon]|nr:50S ribosomal protein L5 [Candidatus Diapherotrites archaeon]
MKMTEISIEKVTINMGVGQTGVELDKAASILKTITAAVPVRTLSKVKQPTWGLRPGLTIGAKVTLRKQKAIEFLKDALFAKDNRILGKNFDNHGNFGFGIREYIDLPKTKYDPKLGIRGFDVLVALKRPGFRIKRRKINKKSIPRRHTISKSEAIEFVKEKFGVAVE